MKNVIFLMLMLSCFTLELKAFTIKSLSADPLDISAVTYKRTSDGRAAALVKVALPIPECEFFGNTVGDTEFKNGEYWVYLEPNSFSLTILTKGGDETTIDFNKFGLSSLEPSATYKMVCELSKKEKEDLIGNIGNNERTEYITPKHLSKVFKKKGEIYYMTQEEWRQQPYSTFFSIERLGLVIEHDGKMFIFPSNFEKDVNGEEIEFTYSQAKEYAKNKNEGRMLTYEEAEYIMSIMEDLQKANEAGLEGGAPYFIGWAGETWISDEGHPNLNFYSSFFGEIYNVPADQKRHLLLVKDIEK